MDQEPHQHPHNPDGTFAKGGPPPVCGPGRPKGAINRITADVKRGIIAGAAAHGRDGNGDGGFDGYCEFLAKHHPRSMAQLIGRLLPYDVRGDLNVGVSGISAVNITTIASGMWSINTREDERGNPIGGELVSSTELTRVPDPPCVTIDNEDAPPPVIEPPPPPIPAPASEFAYDPVSGKMVEKRLLLERQQAQRRRADDDVSTVEVVSFGRNRDRRRHGRRQSGERR
jgi:hypothetical protein